MSDALKQRLSKFLEANKDAQVAIPPAVIHINKKPASNELMNYYAPLQLHLYGLKFHPDDEIIPEHVPEPPYIVFDEQVYVGKDMYSYLIRESGQEYLIAPLVDKK